MPPAARITDPHTCPMFTGPVPHVGGPIIVPCSPTVLINSLPAATVTSMLTCVGPPDVIVKGSSGVFINFLPAARLGDATAHGGVIVAGSPNVIIGEVGQGAPGTSGFSGVVTGTAVAKPPTVLPIVVKIQAHQSGTSGKRIPANKRAVNYLKSSSARVESMSANPPAAVLVRGGHSVSLTATTQPANQPVTWQVVPNQNTHAAPSITPTHGGKRALLGSTSTGSFAVIASSGPSKVVWNVIFVSVEPQPATTKVTKRNNYVNGASPGSVFFKSGEFAPHQYAWEATIDVKLVGGGSDNKMGIDKIELKVLQNGVADTLTAHYQGPPAGSYALEKPKGGLPVLDANDVSSPTLMESIPAATVTPHTGPKRKVWTGDSPTGAFPAAHIHTGKPAVSISGINGFSTAIVSTSTDAPTEYVLHAYTSWQAHFDGTVDPTGQYTPHGAHTSGDAQYQLDSPGIGGRDARNAGFETFPPLYNTGTDTEWKP